MLPGKEQALNLHDEPLDGLLKNQPGKAQLKATVLGKSTCWKLSKLGKEAEEAKRCSSTVMSAHEGLGE